eukprot:Awhi_evm1s6620
MTSLRSMSISKPISPADKSTPASPTITTKSEGKDKRSASLSLESKNATLTSSYDPRTYNHLEHDSSSVREKLEASMSRLALALDITSNNESSDGNDASVNTVMKKRKTYKMCKTLKCPDSSCDRKFSSGSSLSNHIRLKHTSRSY